MCVCGFGCPRGREVKARAEPWGAAGGTAPQTLVVGNTGVWVSQGLPTRMRASAEPAVPAEGCPGTRTALGG